MVHQPVDPFASLRVNSASCRHASIAGERVRADDGARLHPLPEQGQQGLGLYIGHHLGPHLPTQAEDPEDRLLGGATASLSALSTGCQSLVPPAPTYIGLVDLPPGRRRGEECPGSWLGAPGAKPGEPVAGATALLGRSPPRCGQARTTARGGATPNRSGAGEKPWVPTRSGRRHNDVCLAGRSSSWYVDIEDI